MSWPPNIQCGSMPIWLKYKHSQQKYTMDLCIKDSNLNISMRHTLWIYETVQSEYTPMQPKSIRKDSGSSSPPLYSMNLTMRIHVLKSNMVETTWLPVIMNTINKCEGNHHWCRWLPRYQSTIRMNVNTWAEVEDLVESLDQGSMMWNPYRKRRDLPLRHAGSKVLNDF